MKVLVVEDQRRLANLLKQGLAEPFLRRWRAPQHMRARRAMDALV